MNHIRNALAAMLATPYPLVYTLPFTAYACPYPIPYNTNQPPLIKYSDLSFIRNTIAYETQADGSLLQYAVNVPRIDDDGFWHIEAQLTEQVRHNRTLTQANWIKTNCTVSNAAFLAPDGGIAEQITAIVGGDMSVHQVMPNRTGSQANFSVYLRTDSAPQNVNVSFNDGITNVNSTVLVNNTWQRVGEHLRPQAAQPTARITIFGALPGTRLSVWGGTDQFSGQVRFGHIPSFFPNDAGELSRGRDILTGTVLQFPEYMLTKPWGYRWKPGWVMTGTDNDQPQTHEDVTHFSLGPISEEILWAAYDPAAPGPPQIGNIFVRGGPGIATVVPKAVSNTLRINGNETLEIRLYPENGLVWIGGAIEGNGFGPQGTPWTWEGRVTGLQIGDRIIQPNTHTIDSWISEPYAIPPL